MRVLTFLLIVSWTFFGLKYWESQRFNAQPKEPICDTPRKPCEPAPRKPLNNPLGLKEFDRVPKDYPGLYRWNGKDWRPGEKLFLEPDDTWVNDAPKRPSINPLNLRPGDRVPGDYPGIYLDKNYNYVYPGQRLPDDPIYHMIRTK